MFYFFQNELDCKLTIQNEWKKLMTNAQEVREAVNAQEETVRVQLVERVAKFETDVDTFVTHYDSEGPMQPDISPQEATTRLNKFSR